MLFANSTFLGIDPSAGEKPFVYAALDHELNLLALGQGSINDVLAFAAGQRQALAAVCAPQKPNQGVMSRPEVRRNLSQALHPGRWVNFRLADFLLRQHNLSIPQTPATEVECPRWMQMGFTVFRRLQELGYQAYPHSMGGRQYIEVYPYACYAALLGLLPFPKHTFEGRIQRQLVLYDNEVNVPDSMRLFEEITRHRILCGILPLEDLHSPGELDALVAAYTAWRAASQPDHVCMIGDVEEGQVVLPVAELKERY